MKVRMNKVPTPSRPLKKWPTKESIMTADLTYQISGKKTNDQSKLASTKNILISRVSLRFIFSVIIKKCYSRLNKL